VLIYRTSKVVCKMKIIVAGLGYVGLTLALTLADVGFVVVGIDKDKKKIEKLSAGIPTLYEPQIKYYLNSTLSSGNMNFAENIPKENEEATFIVCVGTPVDEKTHEPLLENLKNVVKEIGQNLKKGDHVIIRSTVPVGTTRNIVKPILEQQSNLKTPDDFYLSSAPERTLQGLALQELRQLSQIIGGIDKNSTDKTASIFNRITRTIVRVSSIEAAELIKLFDNTYRDITISIGNMYGKICEKLDLDAREVIEAANYGYVRNKILFPGAGVGGGCLVKDPHLLLYSLKNDVDLGLIRISRQINESMPKDMIKLIESSFDHESRKISDSKILILGFAFKGVPETDDVRYSPTLEIVDYLKGKGAKLYGYDPVISNEIINGLGVEYVKDIIDGNAYDSVIIMNNNPRFKNLYFKKLTNSNSSLLVVDGWYLYDGLSLWRSGIKYFALGSHFVPSSKNLD
ncbi:MAG: nucleotide sugar dehydrogenase, partial [Patescibacteria group bacterium]|nr:nucleotide sugar dehydrogenase [Patescibacteria group bacterium]